MNRALLALAALNVPPLALAGQSLDDGTRFALQDAERIMAEARPFPSAEMSPEIVRYLRHFGLSGNGSAVHWGYLRSGGESLFVQAHLPPDPKGSVLFIHGYMDHSGGHARLYDYLVGRGYAVYALDLPGHGLSTGQRMGITEFEEYGAAAGSLLEAALADGAEPDRLFAMGHSTGCAAWLFHVQRQGNRFRGMLFAAPLVRSAHWAATKWWLTATKGIVRRLPHLNGPRRRRDVLPFPEPDDPLDPGFFPTDWARALIAWEARSASYGPIQGRVTIIQGRKDAVVDFRHNLPFLESLFLGGADARLIQGGHHYVFRYDGPLWEQVEGILDAAFP